MAGLDDGAASDNDDESTNYAEQVLEDIFYHTGGRIREALSRVRQGSRVLEVWQKVGITKKKHQAMLSIVDTKESVDPQKPLSCSEMGHTLDPLCSLGDLSSYHRDGSAQSG